MSEPQPDLEPPQHGLYMLFLLVLVFFLMGLVGFMICHVLKKKGYRCRTSRGSEPDDAQLQPPEDDDMNEDTVERIVRCIIQNEANAEALKEMLGDSEGEGTVQLSSVDATSSLQDGAPSHHHTVHLGSSAPCIHCSRNKRPPLVRQGRSKEGKSRPRPGETTVFSVGRFRVTHIEKRYGLHEHRDGSPTDRSWGMEDSGTTAESLVHLRGTLEPLQSRCLGLEGGAQAQGQPEKKQTDSQANRTPQITRCPHHGEQWVCEPPPSLC
ncbi:hypothetical protein R6Z07F_007145 [Ovis aries]